MKTDNCVHNYDWRTEIKLPRVCSHPATESEVRYFLYIVGKINASRGFILSLSGQWGMMKAIFAPVDDILVELMIQEYPSFKLSAFIDGLVPLPMLQDLGFFNCTDIIVKQVDSISFPALKVSILADGRFVQEIERMLLISCHLCAIGHWISRHLVNLSRHHSKATVFSGFATAWSTNGCTFPCFSDLTHWPPTELEKYACWENPSSSTKPETRYISVDCSKPNLSGGPGYTKFPSLTQ